MLPDAAPTEAIVVFGCSVDSRGHPTPALLRRLETALALARAHPRAPLVVSGGAQGGRPAEAYGMGAWLLAHAVPEGRILREPQALHTRANAELSAEVLAPLRPDRVWLATEAFHLRRSVVLLRLALARRGLAATVTGVAAPDELGRVARRVVAAIELAKLARDLVAGAATGSATSA